MAKVFNYSSSKRRFLFNFFPLHGQIATFLSLPLPIRSERAALLLLLLLLEAPPWLTAASPKPSWAEGSETSEQRGGVALVWRFQGTAVGCRYRPLPCQ